MTDQHDDLKTMQEVFAFLQGEIPESITNVDPAHVPHLTEDQAWTVLWYLGNLYWQVPDRIERCDVCGDLFDTDCGGGYTEDGPPYHFCEGCDHLRPHETERDNDGERDGG